MADTLDELLASLGSSSGSSDNSSPPVDENLIQFKKNRQADAAKEQAAIDQLSVPTKGTGVSISPSNLAALLKPPAGAAERVNANTDNYGVKAVTDEQGNITLTNVGVVPKTPVYPTGPNGAGPGSSSISPNTPLSVGSLYNKLRTSTDVDEARGIAASLREASAIQQTQYESQAQQFAANKLGIPQLQKQLQEAMAADMADPKYRPGMGDSPITARIRQSVNVATDQALQESKVYLNSNPSYAILKSTMVSAEAEVARITKIADRNDQAKFQADVNLEMRRQQRQDILTEQGDSLDPVAKQRMLMLNPDLQNTPPDELSAKMAQTVGGKKTDKEWMAAVQAPEEALPVMALAGNEYAMRLTVSKEAANTGTPEAEIVSKLNNMRTLIKSPGAYKKGLEAIYAGDPKAKEKVAADLEAFNAKNLSANEKGQAEQMKMQVALQVQRKATTMEFKGSPGTWGVKNDPMFDDAVTQTKQITGRTNMLDVLNTYVGKSTGPEAIAKYSIFADYAEAAARKKASSIFGQPSVQELRSEIFKASKKSWLDRLSEGAAQNLATNPMYDALTRNPFDFGQKKQDLNEFLNGPAIQDPKSVS